MLFFKNYRTSNTLQISLKKSVNDFFEILWTNAK